jgi:hypothetical protein
MRIRRKFEASWMIMKPRNNLIARDVSMREDANAPVWLLPFFCQYEQLGGHKGCFSATRTGLDIVPGPDYMPPHLIKSPILMSVFCLGIVFLDQLIDI